jgi:hypothetical protein
MKFLLNFLSFVFDGSFPVHSLSVNQEPEHIVLLSYSRSGNGKSTGTPIFISTTVAPPFAGFEGWGGTEVSVSLKPVNTANIFLPLGGAAVSPLR